MPLLVRWNVGWSEVDAAQFEVFLRSPRQGHVSVMNGIKGSAKQSDVHGCPIARRRLLCSSPVYLLIHEIRKFWIPKRFTGRTRCRFRLTVVAVVVLMVSAHPSATT